MKTNKTNEREGSTVEVSQRGENPAANESPTGPPHKAASPVGSTGLVAQLYHQVSVCFGLSYESLASDATLQKFLGKTLKSHRLESSSSQNIRNLEEYLGTECWDYLCKKRQLWSKDYLQPDHRRLDTIQLRPKHHESRLQQKSKQIGWGKSLLLWWCSSRKYASDLLHRFAQRIRGQENEVELLMYSYALGATVEVSRHGERKEAPPTLESDANPPPVVGSTGLVGVKSAQLSE